MSALIILHWYPYVSLFPDVLCNIAWSVTALRKIRFNGYTRHRFSTKNQFPNKPGFPLSALIILHWYPYVSLFPDVLCNIASSVTALRKIRFNGYTRLRFSTKNQFPNKPGFPLSALIILHWYPYVSLFPDVLCNIASSVTGLRKIRFDGNTLHRFSTKNQFPNKPGFPLSALIILHWYPHVSLFPDVLCNIASSVTGLRKIRFNGYTLHRFFTKNQFSKKPGFPLSALIILHWYPYVSLFPDVLCNIASSVTALRKIRFSGYTLHRFSTKNLFPNKPGFPLSALIVLHWYPYVSLFPDVLCNIASSVTGLRNIRFNGYTIHRFSTKNQFPKKPGFPLSPLIILHWYPYVSLFPDVLCNIASSVTALRKIRFDGYTLHRFSTKNQFPKKPGFPLSALIILHWYPHVSLFPDVLCNIASSVTGLRKIRFDGYTLHRFSTKNQFPKKPGFPLSALLILHWYPHVSLFPDVLCNIASSVTALRKIRFDGYTLHRFSTKNQFSKKPGFPSSALIILHWYPYVSLFPDLLCNIASSVTALRKIRFSGYTLHRFSTKNLFPNKPGFPLSALIVLHWYPYVSLFPDVLCNIASSVTGLRKIRFNGYTLHRFSTKNQFPKKPGFPLSALIILHWYPYVSLFPDVLCNIASSVTALRKIRCNGYTLHRFSTKNQFPKKPGFPLSALIILHRYPYVSLFPDVLCNNASSVTALRKIRFSGYTLHRFSTKNLFPNKPGFPLSALIVLHWYPYVSLFPDVLCNIASSVTGLRKIRFNGYTIHRFSTKNQFPKKPGFPLSPLIILHWYPYVSLFPDVLCNIASSVTALCKIRFDGYTLHRFSTKNQFPKKPGFLLSALIILHWYPYVSLFPDVLCNIASSVTGLRKIRFNGYTIHRFSTKNQFPNKPGFPLSALIILHWYPYVSLLPDVLCNIASSVTALRNIRFSGYTLHRFSTKNQFPKKPGFPLSALIILHWYPYVSLFPDVLCNIASSVTGLRKIRFNGYTIHRFSTKNQFPKKPGFPLSALIILHWYPYVSLFPDVLCNIASSVTALRKIRFSGYTLHRFSTKNQFPNKPGFPLSALIILHWYPYVSLFPDVLCNIASSVTGLRKIRFNGYTIHRFSTKNQFPKKPGFPLSALIILHWYPYVSLFPDVLCNIASSVTGLRKIRFNGYTIHRFSTKNQFPKKPGFPLSALIILHWYPYVSLLPDVLCNIASSVTALRNIRFSGYTLHRFSTKNQFPNKPGFPLSALIILHWYPYVSLFPDVLCNIASSVTALRKIRFNGYTIHRFSTKNQFPKKPGFPLSALIILHWYPYVSLFPDVLCNIASSVTALRKIRSTAIHYIDFPQKISSQRNPDFRFPRW